MPQATKLRLIRGGKDRNAAPASPYTLLTQHIANTSRMSRLATSVAADTELLVEALRYFTVSPRRAV